MAKKTANYRQESPEGLLALDLESQMRTNKPNSPMILEQGQCKVIREAAFDAVDWAQENLPDAFKILLCLIDGAARRQRLVTKWRAQDDPSRELDSDEGLEAILRRELIEIARSHGINDSEFLRRYLR
jgi:hypothetical protein